MSTNSYTTADRVYALNRRVIETAGITLGEMEVYGDDADGLINGMLAVRYGMPLNVASLGPIEPLRSIATRLWFANILVSRVALQDATWMDIAMRMREDAVAQLTSIVSGDIDLLAHANDPAQASLIETIVEPVTTFWSDTQGYRPTFDIRPMEEQHVDRNRLRAEEELDTG